MEYSNYTCRCEFCEISRGICWGIFFWWADPLHDYILNPIYRFTAGFCEALSR